MECIVCVLVLVFWCIPRMRENVRDTGHPFRRRVD